MKEGQVLRSRGLHCSDTDHRVQNSISIFQRIPGLDQPAPERIPLGGVWPVIQIQKSPPDPLTNRGSLPYTNPKTQAHDQQHSLLKMQRIPDQLAQLQQHPGSRPEIGPRALLSHAPTSRRLQRVDRGPTTLRGGPTRPQDLAPDCRSLARPRAQDRPPRQETADAAPHRPRPPQGTRPPTTSPAHRGAGSRQAGPWPRPARPPSSSSPWPRSRTRGRLPRPRRLPLLHRRHRAVAYVATGLAELVGARPSWLADGRPDDETRPLV